MEVDIDEKPNLPPISAKALKGSKGESRKVYIPNNRLNYLQKQENWMKMATTITEHLKLEMRFHAKSRQMEIRVGKETTDIGAIQKGADFLLACALGFDIGDAVALVRLDELYLESFEVTDVKPLKGDHLARAIGRIAGKCRKTKHMIENQTKTRIVLADSKVHLLGSFYNVKIARRAICSLILGSPPSKVYGVMRAVAARACER